MSNNHTPIDHLVEEHNKGKKDTETASITKEGEPIVLSSEQSFPPEIEVIETEPKIEDKEVGKYVKPTVEEPSIDPKLKKAGLQAIDSSSLDPRHHVDLPISDEKILEGLGQPITSSFRWLAETARFILSGAHLSLKKVHGKVVRVMKK
jgi:hypothetical protein